MKLVNWNTFTFDNSLSTIPEISKGHTSPYYGSSYMTWKISQETKKLIAWQKRSMFRQRSWSRFSIAWSSLSNVRTRASPSGLLGMSKECRVDTITLVGLLWESIIERLDACVRRARRIHWSVVHMTGTNGGVTDNWLVSGTSTDVVVGWASFRGVVEVVNTSKNIDRFMMECTVPRKRNDFLRSLFGSNCDLPLNRSNAILQSHSEMFGDDYSNSTVSSGTTAQNSLEA